MNAPTRDTPRWLPNGRLEPTARLDLMQRATLRRLMETTGGL